MIPLKALKQLEAEGWDDKQRHTQWLAMTHQELDLSHLDPTRWKGYHMDELRLAAIQGITVDCAAAEDYGWTEKRPRRADGRLLPELDPTLWEPEQLEQHAYALSRGVDITNLDPRKWTFGKMREQVFALQLGFDHSLLEPTKWDKQSLSARVYALKRGEEPENLSRNAVRR